MKGDFTRKAMESILAQNPDREALRLELSETRALLAQRDAELEALRETVHGVRELVTLFNHTAVYDLKSDILAALSDNPESPALTDKEA